MKIEHIVETDSTNRWLREHDGEDDMAVWADFQTAGRGCGNNTWESERGKNLLFSVRCHPANVPANRQFLLTEAMALAVKNLFDCCGLRHPLTIKWPNDIYWCDRKLAGTLSECTLSGQTIRQCIIGTGVNLNQTKFQSDAPNPVSIAQIRDTPLEVEPTLQRLLSCFGNYLRAIDKGEWDVIHEEYVSSLYRRAGYHAYTDQKGRFEAKIVTVEPDGHLQLRDRLGLQRRYLFKEVQFVL